MKHRIESLEGLRGLMALWVFTYHVSSMAALPLNKIKGIGILLANGGLAVNVFIILSGFVIALMLSKQGSEPYKAFITKRAFRLFPAYLICLILAVIMLGPSIAVLKEIPWLAGKTGNRLEILLDTKTNFWQHLSLHSIMLHGLIPDTILKNSSYTFIGQAWSLTLEWQFYIIAPLLFGAVAKLGNKLVIRMVVLLAAVGLSFIFKQPSFILSKLSLFLVGYYSFQFYTEYRKSEITFNQLLIWLCIQGVVVALLGMELISYVIWIVVLILSLKKESVLGRLQYAILENKYALWLGKVSYSFYCVHMICIYAVSYLLIIVFKIDSHFTYAVLLITMSLVIALILSELLNKYVEVPMIGKGKKITEKFYRG